MKYIFTCIFIIMFSGCAKNEYINKNISCENSTDFQCETPLHDAIRAKNLNEVKYLTNKKNINIQNSEGYTPLHLATRLNQYEIAKFLINKGATVNSKDKYGDTPLIDSARNNTQELSKLLICNKANPETLDKYNIKAMDYIPKDSLIYKNLQNNNFDSFCKTTKVIVTLLEHNKDVNSVYVSNKNGMIILDTAYQSTILDSKKDTKPSNIITRSKNELLKKYPELLKKKKNLKVKVTLLEHYKDKSSVIINNNLGNIVLDKAYQSSYLAKKTAPTEIETNSKKDIFEKYGYLIKEKMNLNFKYNSTEVTEQTKQNLDEIIDYINSCKTCKIIINGHTDTVGEKNFNLKLSKMRANAIKSLLEENGINKNRVLVKYYGESKPFVKTADETKHPLNRRVTITVKRMDK